MSSHALSQILFTVDKNLKKKVLAKAKAQGITLKALFIFCMKSFVEDRVTIGIIAKQEPQIDARGIVVDDQEMRLRVNSLLKMLRYWKQTESLAEKAAKGPPKS